MLAYCILLRLEYFAKHLVSNHVLGMRPLTVTELLVMIWCTGCGREMDDYRNNNESTVFT